MVSTTKSTPYESSSGVAYTPGLTSISTHNSKAYLLGHETGVGEALLLTLSLGSSEVSAPAGELT